MKKIANAQKRIDDVFRKARELALKKVFIPKGLRGKIRPIKIKRKKES